MKPTETTSFQSPVFDDQQKRSLIRNTHSSDENITREYWSEEIPVVLRILEEEHESVKVYLENNDTNMVADREVGPEEQNENRNDALLEDAFDMTKPAVTQDKAKRIVIKPIKTRLIDDDKENSSTHTEPKHFAKNFQVLEYSKLSTNSEEIPEKGRENISEEEEAMGLKKKSKTERKRRKVNQFLRRSRRLQKKQSKGLADLSDIDDKSQDLNQVAYHTDEQTSLKSPKAEQDESLEVDSKPVISSMFDKIDEFFENQEKVQFSLPDISRKPLGDKYLSMFHSLQMENKKENDFIVLD